MSICLVRCYCSALSLKNITKTFQTGRNVFALILYSSHSIRKGENRIFTIFSSIEFIQFIGPPSVRSRVRKESVANIKKINILQTRDKQCLLNIRLWQSHSVGWSAERLIKLGGGLNWNRAACFVPRSALSELFFKYHHWQKLDEHARQSIKQLRYYWSFNGASLAWIGERVKSRTDTA